MLPLYINIKNKRTQIGMSQTELAKKIGYTDRSSIAKIEAGKVDLPQSKIKAIANALETTPGQLMGWGEEKEKPPVQKDEELEAAGYYNLTPDKRALVDALIRQLADGKGQ